MSERKRDPASPSRRPDAAGDAPERAPDWADSHSISPWRQPLGQDRPSEVAVDCGWGRVIFAHTFPDNERLAEELREEIEGRRDIAFYLPDPHVLIALGPQEFFLDPSHTYRLWFDRYEPSDEKPRGFQVRPIETRHDCDGAHALYRARQMVPPEGEWLWEHRNDPETLWLVAVDDDQRVVGVVLGIDHVAAFEDPERGASLWSLAVAPQAPQPGIGQALVRGLIEHFRRLGRAHLDLSVMHDNREAIALYEKLGFERVPVFAVKRKNPINEPLFVRRPDDSGLNPYAALIVNEARRRGIDVELVDAEEGYFRLTLGGRSVLCRESLTERTTAIAMSRCDDKHVTWKLLHGAGLRVPDQRLAGTKEENEAFLAAHGRLVVKPRRGEQGSGVSVDVRSPEVLAQAVRRARGAGGDVLLEQCCPGADLRVIVIDDEVVAAAVRRPASVTGDGRHRIRELIRKQSRRREAATGGESRIPVDGETRRCIEEAGHSLSDVLPAGEMLQIRKTANLHTGGTIHDVTDELHPTLVDVSRRAARVLGIPVVGLDLLVPRVDGSEYVLIEANERPGLANHEPQPTAERFVDFLFPETRVGRAPAPGEGR